MLSTRAQSSSLLERWWRRLRWRRRRPQQSPQFPRTPRQSLRQGRQTIQEGPVPVMQPVQIVGRPLGPLKTIIEKEVERSCVEKSERLLAGEATADSPTAERKARQQVVQRRKECKQPKVQKRRERSMRRRHVSDDDPQRQAVKSNDFLRIGQLKLTATVCHQCKAVYRSVMECHDTMSSLAMECHEEVVTSRADSARNCRCARFPRTRCRQATLRRCQQWRSSGTTGISVREETVKQRNVKAWKATHFRSETENPRGEQEQKSMRSHHYSDWKRLSGGSSEW